MNKDEKYEKYLKEEIFGFNKVLFNSRRNNYPQRDHSELYEETISIITDIIFIFLAAQRNLNNVQMANLESGRLIEVIKDKVTNLGYNNILDENWDEQVLSYLYDLNNYFSNNMTKTDILSILVEDTWEKNEETILASKNGSSKDRREKGSYYTENELIDVIIKNTIDPLCNSRSVREILQLKVLDPAVGSGAFLIATLKRLMFHIEKKHDSFINNKIRIEYKRKIVENCIHGVDINSNALKAAIYSLWLEVEDEEMPIELIQRKLIEGDSLLASHWDISKVHKDVEVLKMTNYYITGKLIMGEVIDDWVKIYNNILESTNTPKSNIYTEAITLGQEYKSFIWQLEFYEVYEYRGGFDAVVGNPPWNKVKAHIKEFFEHYDVEIKGMQGNELKNYISGKFLSKPYYEKLWNQYINYIKSYSDAISNSQHFEYQTCFVKGKRLGGERDLYKYFLELTYKLIHTNGYVGLILPASIIQSQGATCLRKLLLNNSQIELLITVENRDSIFPIDSRFKYALLVFNKTKSPNENLKCKFMLKSVKEVNKCLENKLLLNLPKELIEILSPDYKTFPDLKSQYEIDILKKVYKANPLINSSKGWKIQFFRELDMTNDSHLFIHKEQLDKVNYTKDEYVPLYEGRMVHQFDFASKKYLHGEGRQAKWINLDWDNKEIWPHFFVSKTDAELKFLDYNKARPCYCDIAGQTNERAVQTALLPKGVIAGNKVPTIKIHPNNIANNLLWIAVTNSFVFDWLTRLRISTTINFFHWDQLPLPIIDVHSEEGKILIKNSAKLSLVTSYMDEVRKEVIEFYRGEFDLNEIKPSVNPLERQQLRAEIDALVAKLYGLDVSDLAYILYQFPLLDRKQPSLPNDKSINSKKDSSFITRDLVLYQFLQMKDQDKTINIVELYKQCQINIEGITGDIKRLNERVSKAKEIGAIAYIPG